MVPWIVELLRPDQALQKAEAKTNMFLVILDMTYIFTYICEK